MDLEKLIYMIASVLIVGLMVWPLAMIGGN